MGNWVIEIDSSRHSDICTTALVPFEEVVPLDVLGLPAGTYTVTAGEQSATYTLEMDNRVSDALPAEVEITLERTACFGTCPIYTLVIYGDGTAVFNGTDFVSQTGEYTTTIAIDDISHLVGEFVQAGYFDWNDAYTNREMTDMPTVITSIKVDGQYKQIEHYIGDISAPEALTALEDLIDATVNSSQWIGEPSVGMANPASVNCEEMGGRVEMRTDADGGQYGVCIFEDGSECEEWALFNGECVPGEFTISWEMASDLVRGGFVNGVFQGHDLSVRLGLKDGRFLTTTEPQIDDIFALIKACGDDCSDIVMATE
jgi:putative hemolysin